MKISETVFQITVNIFVALLLGLSIDKATNDIKMYLSKYKNPSKGLLIARVLFQLVINIVIFMLLEMIYRKFNLSSIRDSVFFISVFLGVQQSLFTDIYNVV